MSIESLTGFSVPEITAIEEFLRSCTVPLVREENDQLVLMGTGTFFRSEERLWIGTASHVVDTEEDLRQLSVPLKTADQYLSLGNCTLYRPDNLNLDVAIVLIQDKEFEQHVSENWRVLNEKNLTRFDPHNSRYIVAGYPKETLARKNLNWREAFTQIYTSPYPGGATDADHSILRLSYAERAPSSLGSVTDTPHLGGLSGSSVWAIEANPPFPWAAEKILKVVAIQVSFKHSEYIGAEWWTLVREVFRHWADEQEPVGPRLGLGGCGLS